jgi:hypothetical protein
MKYANKLTDEELRELYLSFIDGAKINELHITKDDCSIAFEGYIEIPEFDEEILKENPNATIVVDDDYELDDFDVKAYHHSGNVTKAYREYMYKKFGDEYAKDYLLGKQNKDLRSKVK